jgi:hypothetical protein
MSVRGLHFLDPLLEKPAQWLGHSTGIIAAFLPQSERAFAPVLLLKRGMSCGEVLFVVTRVNHSICCDDVKPRIYTGFNVVGRDIGGIVDEARKTLAAQIRLPQGYTMEWGGGVRHVWFP